MKKFWPFIFPAYLIAHRSYKLIAIPETIAEPIKYFIQQGLLPFSNNINSWFVFLFFSCILGIFYVGFKINNFLLEPCSEKIKRKYQKIDLALYISFFAVYIFFITRVHFKGTFFEFFNYRIEFWARWYLVHLGLWCIAKLFLCISILRNNKVAKESFVLSIKSFFKEKTFLAIFSNINSSLVKWYRPNWLFITALFLYLSTINSYLIWSLTINDRILYERALIFNAIALFLTLIQTGFFIIAWEFINRNFQKVIKKIALFLLCSYLIGRGIEAIALTKIGFNLYTALQYFAEDPLWFISRLQISTFTFAFDVITWFLLSLTAFFFAQKQSKFFHKMYINHYAILLTTIVLLSCTTIFNYYSVNFTTFVIHKKYQKIIPMPHLMPSLKCDYIPIKTPIAKLPKEQEMLTYLNETEFEAKRKPDIYIIILESMRGDFVNHDNAPNLHNLKQDALSFNYASAGSTCTWHSWYCLFLSRIAHGWEQAMKDKAFFGSLHLNALKKAGYKIHAIADPNIINKTGDYSSLGYDWWEFCNVCFGEGNNVIDTTCPVETWDPNILHGKFRATRDKVVAQKAIEKTKGSNGGNLYMICLDAGHGFYTWSDDFDPPYHPTYPSGKSVPNRTKNLKKRTKAINQYKNDYKCMDKRVGELISSLKRRNQYDNSIIIVLGDHGQACFEHGFMTHGGTPHFELANIPLYYKFLSEDNEKIKAQFKIPVTSQIDIFPTLFDYLGIEPINSKFVVGKSIFQREHHYAIAVTPNDDSHPWEITFCNDKHKCIARFNNRNIFKADKLLLTNYSDIYDNEIIDDIPRGKWAEKIYNEFKPALSNLLTTK